MHAFKSFGIKSTWPIKAFTAILLCPFVIASTTTFASDKANESSDEIQIRREVDRLIQDLGDASYAKRMRARGELQRMGLLAFDALHSAQMSDDSEIALAARYLVESLHVSWSMPDDSTEVQEILEEYGTLPEIERKSRMDRLSQLPQREGLAALCRLVRFETKLRLSRAAALLVMQQEPEATVDARRRNGELIVQALATNSRVASKWLVDYAKDLGQDRYSASVWRSHIETERARVANQVTQATDDNAVLDLYRICAVRAMQIGNDQESRELALESLELVESRRQPLRNATQWALDHQMWDIVLKLQDRDPSEFRSDALLAYSVAEALAETGKPKQGEAWVSDALEIAPLAPLNEDGSSPMSADAREQAARHHAVVAKELVQRGRFAWAQREYEYLVERTPVDTTAATDARWYLSMLHSDLQRHQEAADTLRPAVERMMIDRDFRRVVDRELYFDFDDFESRMHYNDGLAHLEAKRLDQAAESLQAALRADPLDGDILIAMYRYPGDDAWKAEIRRAMRSALTEYERVIRDEQRQIGGINQLQQGRIISHYCNQYAWLVANTEGDFNRALAYSRRSLELTPKLASLTDTLAHCYYAVGDYDAAVRTQREAVALEPHSPPIRRQLDFFIEKQRAANQATSDSASE